MKMFIAFMLIISNSYAYQCDQLVKDSKKAETISYISNEIFNESMQEFCDDGGFLDLEVYFVPNLFLRGEVEDDHYKMMVHYNYKSCTFIYNITQKHISKKSCYSTW